MMKPAIILAVEQGKHEDSYEELACLLAYSIRHFHKDIDIYCGVFSDNVITEQTRENLQHLDVTIVEDIIFKDSDIKQSIVLKNNTIKYTNYMNRSYCQYYFSKKLLDSHDYLIYLDIDIVLLKPINFLELSMLGKSVVTYDYPKEAIYLDNQSVQSETIGVEELDIDGELYFNFIAVINKHNKHIFESVWNNIHNFKTYNLKFMTEFSNTINREKINRVENPKFAAWYPHQPITDDTVFFHHDGFHERGTLNRLKDITPLYEIYIDYLNKIGVKLNSSGWYYENKVLNMLKDRIALPIILKNPPDYNRWLKLSENSKFLNKDV